MNTRIRCADCRRLDEQDWCTHYVDHVPFPRHWRHCDWYAGLLPIAAIRAALADADLLRYVAELRDTDEGRLLRLRHGLTEQRRFVLYRLVGITVLENDPAIIGKATKGHRAHGGIADDSDPRMPETRAA
ncbi:MAG: hypothetical protein K9L88_07740 [Chromatiaceae bacterium]|nr:hypothetical protein [Chromatiaceae bacterium]